MASITFSIPDFTDAELVFDDQETRQILIFFWPAEANRIDQLVMSNDLRRFAQILLVAAVDASYALGFVDATFRAVARPGAGIKALCSKLGRRFVRHWFKHATQRDLMDAKIYVMVRDELARTFKARRDAFFQNVASRAEISRTIVNVVFPRTTVIVRI